MADERKPNPLILEKDVVTAPVPTVPPVPSPEPSK